MFRNEILSRKKQVVIFLAGIGIILFSFLLVIKFQGVTRQSEVFLLNDPNAAKLVNSERQDSTAPFIMREIFSNKPLYYLRVIRENYLEAFSTNYLFLYGETGLGAQIDNIFFRGELYIIELPLLLFGIYKLLVGKNSLARNFLFSLLLISPLPSAITMQKSFVIRDFMMLPILLIITALGFYFVIKKFLSMKKYYSIILLLSVFFVYSFLFAEYFYQYYYRWPVYGAEAWGASSRDLVNFVAKNKSNYKNIYISNSLQDFLIQYATFEKLNPRLIQKVWNENPIKIYNITMLQNCLNNGDGSIKDFLPSNSLYISSFNDCHYVGTPSAKIVDRGEPLHTIWNIYEN